jgi:ATP-dependent Lon protease
MSRLFFILLTCYLTFAFMPMSAPPAWAQNQENQETQETQDKTKPAEKKKADSVKDQQEKSTEEEESDSSETPPASVTFNRADIKISDPVNKFSQQKADLQHYLNAEQIKPLLVGTEEYLTVIETNTTANSKGVMILVPDWQQSATSSKALNYLSKQLPLQGWTTITVHPPSKPDNYPSMALKQDVQREENSKTIEQYQKNLADVILSVNEKAKTYPGIIVVVAQGHHASLLANIYQKMPQDKPAALVMLSGYLNTQTENIQAAKNLAQTSLPILDLSLQRDHHLVATNVQLRKRFSNQELKTHFRQKQFNNIATGNYPKATLLKEINGWLKSIGW